MQQKESIIEQFQGKFRTVLIFGPPGAGKGTVSKTLSGAGNMCHVSTGDIYRGLSKETPAGKLLDSYMSKGTLVPDEIAIAVWHQYMMGLISTNRFLPVSQYLLLDGMPRTLNQANILDKHLEVEHIILLEVKNEEELIRRLQKRALLEGRKDDADEKVLKKRFDVYRTQTEEVLAYYPKELITRINGQQFPLEVLRDILDALATPLSCGKTATKAAC
jgi:adenylate kinase